MKSPSSAIKKPGSGVVSPNDGKTRVFGKPALKSPSAVVVPKVSGSSSVTSSNDGKTRVFGTPQRIASEPGTPASQIAPPVAAQPPAPAPEDGIRESSARRSRSCLRPRRTMGIPAFSAPRFRIIRRRFHLRMRLRPRVPIRRLGSLERRYRPRHRKRNCQ